MPVAMRSKAGVCGRSLARIVGSNPVGGSDVCLLRLTCCQWPLRRVDYMSIVALPNVAPLSVIVKPR